MTRYISGKKKVTPFLGLSTNRNRYLGLEQAEPNLGYPGEKIVPISSVYYSLVTINNGTVYDRYWIEPGIYVQDENNLVGAGNTFSKLKFVGLAVTVTGEGSTAKITVFSPGNDNQVIFNNSGEFAGGSQLYYDDVQNRVGIGTALPTESLHVEGSFRITGEFRDSLNQVGAANQFYYLGVQDMA